VTTATYTKAKIEELLEAAFSIGFVPSLCQERMRAVVRAIVVCKEREFAIAL
jgi:hypothetical protein